jgi:hypothetical protein
MSHFEHFLKQLNDAIAKGFTYHFRILPCGLIRCIDTNKEYTLDEIKINANTCVDCRLTFYRITTVDGVHGTASEDWDV